jgi:Flp pilus assembly protein TadD
LAIAGVDGKARIWDANRGKLLLTIEHGRNWIWQVVFSTDGNRLATASVDGTARIWDSEGCSLAETLTHGGDIEWIAFSADGRFLLTAGTRVPDGSNRALGQSDMPTPELKGLARVWEVRSGKPLPLVCMHDKRVRHATFSSDGRYVITASDDRTARVWDVRTAEPVSPPLPHPRPVYHATFGADERFVVTSSLPGGDGIGETRVWDALTGHPVTPPFQHFVHYSGPDVHQFLFGDGPGTSKKLPIDVAWTISGPPAAELTTDFRLLVRASPFEMLAWNLTPDRRPMKQVVVEAQVRPGSRIDVTGTAIRVDMQAAWKELQKDGGPLDKASADRVQLDWHRQQADVCESSGNSFALLWHLKRLVDGGQQDWQLHHRQGNAYTQLGQWEDAIKEYTHALGGEKNAWQVWAARGKAHVLLGKVAEGRSDAAAALRLNESAAEAYLIKGMAFVAERAFGKALKEFTKAIKLKPALWEAWAHRAKAHYEVGNLAEALTDWKKADQLQPGVYWVVCGRADVYRRLGRLEDAEADYSQALALNLNYADEEVLAHVAAQEARSGARPRPGG